MNRFSCFRVGTGIYPTLELATAQALKMPGAKVEVLFRGCWMTVADAVALLAASYRSPAKS